MGCDIHMIAEVRDESGKWVKIGKAFKNPWYDPNRENKIDPEDGYEWNPEFTDKPYDYRNYDLFSILADVRNGYGFAGVVTGEGFIPISDPKGIPDDASEEAKQFMNSYGGDGHSHSFFTVAELLAYDWDQKSTKQGVVGIGQYEKLKGTGDVPENWCGMVSGPKILVSKPDEITPETTHVVYKWEIKYSDHCKNFLSETIPTLDKLGKPEDVRILFFFDN